MGEERPSQEGSSTMMEKSWTLEELRKGANDWSMSSDAGMLQYLQDYSQKMISRTHELQQQLSTVLHESKLTSVRVNSAFNDFIMLANTQFVENRVYDEDVTQEEEEEDKDSNTAKKEKTKEEREAELVPKISEAMKLGLGVIDTAFEKLDINEANSESEDDEPGYKPEAILEPKDPYLNRPLPYLIGSQSFLQDDDVGLIDYMSDEEQPEEEEEESESETESEPDSPEESPIKTDRQIKDSDSDDFSDEGSDLFGGDNSSEDFESSVRKKPQTKSQRDESSEESEDEEDQQQGRSARDFTSELAVKIGAAPVAPPEEKVHHKDSNHTKKKKDKAKKQPKPPDDEDEDGLFGPPKQSVDEFDDDESPFGQGGGLFSSRKSGGLFDDEEGDLFNEVTAPNTKKERTASPVQQIKDKQASPADSPKPVIKSSKKKPAGGVSIFGDDEDDLFSMPSETTVETTKKQTTTKSSSVTQASKPPPSSGGLFDGSGDEEDLFDIVAKPATTSVASKSVKKQSTKSALFDESDEDEGDLFADQPSITDSKSTAPAAKEEKPVKKKPEHKLPPGAVSMFGQADNPLVAALKAKQKNRPQSDTEEENEEDEVKSTHSASSKASSANQLAPKKEKSPSLSSNSLFAEEPDDLFSSSASKVSTTVTTTVKDSKVTNDGTLSSSDGYHIWIDAQKGGGSWNATSSSNKGLPVYKDIQDHCIPVPKIHFRRSWRKSIYRKLLCQFGNVADNIGKHVNVMSLKRRRKRNNFTVSKRIRFKQDLPCRIYSVPGTSHIKTGGIFGESDEDNDDDLFSITSKPAAKASDKSKSKAHTLLFDEDEEDIFATSTTKQSPQTEKKKPVGGVSIFGGADLFGINNNSNMNTPSSSVDSKPEVTQKQEPSSAPQTKKVEKVEIEKRSKVNSISLFDDDDEGDIFGDEPKPKETTSKETSKKTKTSGKGLFEDEDLLFGAKEEDPSVDLFGKTSPLKTKSKEEIKEVTSVKETISEQRTEITKTASAPAQPTHKATAVKVGGATEGSSTTDLFGDDDDEDDLFAEPSVPARKPPEEDKPKKLAGAVSMFGGMDPTTLLKKKGPAIGDKPKPEVSQKPAKGSRQQQSVEDPIFDCSVDTADNKPSVTRRPTPDPLFGGSVDPSNNKPSVARRPTTVKSTTSTKQQGSTISKITSGISINPAALLPGAAPPQPDTEPKAVDFDEPIRTVTLTSVSKDRPKIQQNRRPPSRRARKARADHSGPDFLDTTDHAESQGHRPGISDHRSGPSILQNGPVASSFEDDLPTSDNSRSALGSYQTNLHHQQPHQSSSASVISNNHTIVNNIEVTNTNERVPKQQQVRTATTHDIFSSDITSSTNLAKASQNYSNDGNEEDDLFFTSKKETKKTVVANNTITTSSSVTKVKQNKTKDLFGSDDEDEGDIFTQLKSKTFTDDEISGVTDKLFDALSKPRSGTGDSRAMSGSGGGRGTPTEKHHIETREEQAQSVEKSSSSEKSVDTTQKVQSWLEKSEPVVKPSSKSVFDDGDDDIFAHSASTLSNTSSKHESGLKSVINNEPVQVTKVTQHQSNKSSVRKANIDYEDDDLFSSSKTTTTVKKVTKSSHLENNNDKDDIFTDSNLTSKKTWAPVRGPLDNDDLFSSSNKTLAKKVKAAPIMDDLDDIFADSSLHKRPNKQPARQAIDDDIFGDSSLNRNKTKQPARKPIDDDIFGDVKPKSKPGFTIPDIDDIFAGSRISVKPIPPTATEDIQPGTAEGITPGSQAASGVTDIFDDASQQDPRKNIAIHYRTTQVLRDISRSDETSDQKAEGDHDIFGDVPSGNQTQQDNDDIFADSSVKSQTSKAKKKKHATKDEDIFKDDTDIFADIPSSKPKDKKSKKKPLFKDDSDDIFADTTSVSVTAAKKSTKTSSKKTKTKTRQNLDDAPNIFDDPLNALK